MIPTKHQTLKINSNAQSLRLVERLVADICEVYDVNEDVYGNMIVAVTEAVNNAVVHGNKNDSEKFVKIGFEADDKLMTFSISDEGTGFDYNNLPDPTDPANLGKISGRGVFLMGSLSNSIRFENNGSTVLLGFNG